MSMGIDDGLEGLDVLAKAPDDVTENDPTKSWEELVSAWTTVVELEGAAQWKLGDIANEVTRTFGKSAIESFASSVGEKPATVKQYAWVSRAFPKSSDRQTGLTYSHYRAAVKTESPMEWIEEAVKNAWTVAQLVEEIKNVEDAVAPAGGVRCDACDDPLPEEGAYHIRRNGTKVAAVCCARCGLAWFLNEVKQNEFAERVAA